MKLIFKKDDDGEIKAQIQAGTILTDFSYTEMVKQLLENNEIEDPVFENLGEDEKSRIREMLDKISEVFSDT